MKKSRSETKTTATSDPADIRYIHRNPPRLEKRYQPIHSLPLHDRLKGSTAKPIQWLARVQHQIRMSKEIREQAACLQQSIRPFLISRSKGTQGCPKYPP